MLREGLEDVDDAVEPGVCQPVDAVGQDGEGQALLRECSRAGDEALEAAGMADAGPGALAPRDRAEPVMPPEAAFGVRPEPAGHLAAAERGEEIGRGGGVDLGEEPGDVGGRRDKAGGGGHGVAGVVGGDDDPLADGVAPAMTLGHRPGPEPEIGRGLFQPGTSDDLARDPVGIRLARHLLDDEAEEREAVVGILEALRGRIGRRERKIGEEFFLREIGPAIGELARIEPVAHEAGAVRDELGHRHAGDVGMEAVDIGADAVVEPQSPGLGEAEQSGGGEGLGMGGDAEAVARRQRFARREVGAAEGGLQDDVASAGHGDGAAGLIVMAPLELHPTRNVIQCGGEPGFHRLAVFAADEGS